MSARTLGALGEQAAAEFLLRKGFRVLERNLRTRLGEIDLVCRDQATVVFVEVKTRSRADVAQPYESVGMQKRSKLRRLAEQYLHRHRLDSADARFDVVSVTLGTRLGIEHIIGAF
jgi:putative endonuclease